MENSANSLRRWKDDIVLLINEFVQEVNSQYASLITEPLTVNKRSLDRIWYTYDKELEKFKRKYLKKSSKDKEVKIDYHKITALYLKVFLIFEPIRLTHEGLEKRKEISDIQFEYIMDHANEIFCASLIEVIFRGNGWDDDTKRPEKRLMLSDKEKRWLIILLNHYRIYPDTIDVLSLAHTVYYLEQARFRLP